MTRRARARLDVVCFGEILCDLFEVDDGTFRFELGGESANVATCLARLGVRAAVAGGVGCDFFGDALVRHLAKDGVDTRFVVRFPNRTGVTFVKTADGGSPRFLPYRLDSADVAIGEEHVVAAMARARWIVVGTSALLTHELRRASWRLLRLARLERACVFVDLNARPHLWPDRGALERAARRLVRSASIVKATEADLRTISGRSSTGWLEHASPRATWIVTRGEGVASAMGAHGRTDVRARRARCVDTTGAGDAFVAGSFATLLAAGATPGSRAWRDPRTWRAALEVGHAMGARAISRAGAVAGIVSLAPARRAIDRVRGASP
jgi:sugar/nucleoside kinase (ribokinase family)